MRKVVHLLDDPSPGGVLNNVCAIQTQADLAGLTQERRLVDSGAPDFKRFPFEIIVVHFSLAWKKLPYLLALRLLHPSACLVLQEHHYCAEHFCAANSVRRFKVLVLLARRLFDLMIVVSPSQRDWYQGLGVSIDEVIPPMPPVAALCHMQLPPRSPRLTVGVSGRFDHVKGFDLITELVKKPAARQFNFVVAGDGPLVGQITSLAKRYANITYVGRYQDPRDYLKFCDIVLVPSRQETFGLACLEAKAAGRPVVSTPVAALVDQVQGTGAVATGFSAIALLSALKSLPAHTYLDALGRKARKEARQLSSQARTKWLNILTGANT